MSITPSKIRCEKKLAEIEVLKQKEYYTKDDLEKIGQENYYKNIMEQVYAKTCEAVTAHAVSPLTIGEDRVMVKCNYGKDVYKHIHTDGKYVIEMPNINTVLNVKCTFAAFRAADMYIETAFVNGQRDPNSETCTISYNYDNFDSIYYTSFRSPDACNIYTY